MSGNPWTNHPHTGQITLLLLLDHLAASAGNIAETQGAPVNTVADALNGVIVKMMSRTVTVGEAFDLMEGVGYVAVPGLAHRVRYLLNAAQFACAPAMAEPWK